MRHEDFEAFRDGISGVYAFYGKDVSAFALDVWWNALKPFDLSAVRDAFNRHLMNPDSGQYLPKPADITRMLGGTTQDAALVAWSKVDRAVRHIGTYADVVFDDPIIHRVLHDMGGWIGLGMKAETEWPFVAREFDNRYRGFRMRSERPEYPRVLTGLANAHNTRNGHDSEPPRLIGHVDTCRRVMEGGTDAPLLSMSRAGDAISDKLRLVKGDKDAA
jgi:hypothetical protein